MIRLLTVLAFLVSYNLAYADDDDVIRTDTNSTVTSNGSMDTTIYSPPPSAISPNLTTGTGDLCTISASGSIQTQILGLSIGKVFTEDNCLRLKNAKTMYDMGMKVAAVSTMCQDPRVFNAMMMAGTPCPYDGMIGQEAKAAWEVNAEEKPDAKKEEEGLTDGTKTLLGGAGVASLLLLLLL